MKEYKTIGMVVAIEVDSVFKKYGNPITTKKLDGFDVFTYKINENKLLYVVKCGPGEIASAGATQFCISNLNCELILNFGIVGGLTEEMSDIATCVVDKIVHYDYDTTYIDKDYVVGQYNDYKDAYIPTTKKFVDMACKIEPTLKKVVCASADKFIGDPNKKSELHKTYNADICEMESAGIALTCNRCQIPMLMIKCVSDGCNSGENDFFTNFTKSANTCFDIMSKIIEKL